MSIVNRESCRLSLPEEFSLAIIPMPRGMQSQTPGLLGNPSLRDPARPATRFGPLGGPDHRVHDVVDHAPGRVFPPTSAGRAGPSAAGTTARTAASASGRIAS
jgi:hypothetical protein